MRIFFLIMIVLCLVASIAIQIAASATMPAQTLDGYFYLSNSCLGMAVIFAACYFVVLGKDK